MAFAPNNLVPVQLPEDHATTLAEHSAHFDGIHERFARIDKQFEEIPASGPHHGLSTTAYHRSSAPS